MVIGNGDIASVLKDREDFLFFASGVSNSQCNEQEEFNREFLLLYKQKYTSDRLVYFSTLSIYDKDTPYTKHKAHIEWFIKRYFKNYCIIRLGNITWGNNPNTIINYFKNCKEKPELRDEYKYLCTPDEFNYWIEKIPDFNTEMNITGERIHVTKLYERIHGI